MTKIKHDGGRYSQDMPSATAVATNVTVGATSTLIIAANANRSVCLVRVVNNGPVYINAGAAAVVANHFPVTAGEVFAFEGSQALYGIVGSGTADVRVWEETS